jgi:hypothetical protein
MFFSCVFQGGAATEVYKMILKETGDAMSARVREVFQRRSLKRQSTHFGHSHMWMDGDDCSGAYSGDKGDDTKAIVQQCCDSLVLRVFDFKPTSRVTP